MKDLFLTVWCNGAPSQTESVTSCNWQDNCIETLRPALPFPGPLPTCEIMFITALMVMSALVKLSLLMHVSVSESHRILSIWRLKSDLYVACILCPKLRRQSTTLVSTLIVDDLNQIYFYNCWTFKVKMQSRDNLEIFIFIILSVVQCPSTHRLRIQ